MEPTNIKKKNLGEILRSVIYKPTVLTQAASVV
jgi:hypothetical protein